MICLSDTDKEFNIDLVIQTCNKVYHDEPVLAQLAATQAILESGLVRTPPSNLAYYHNNLFGIKGTGTNGSIELPTHEYVNGEMITVGQNFADNNTLEDSVEQHRKLMSLNRYTEVRNSVNIGDAIDAIYRCGYATDPNYTNILWNVYQTYIEDV